MPVETEACQPLDPPNFAPLPHDQLQRPASPKKRSVSQFVLFIGSV